jgi:transposase
MKRLDYSKVIGEALEDLESLYRRQSRSLARRRLRFLILLKGGGCFSQVLAGARIGIKPRASEKLWALYRARGIPGLLEKPHSGQPPKLDNKAKEALRTELDKGGIQTLREACTFVLHKRGIAISKAAMHRYFKAQGIKKKTGRPTNVRKDTKGEAAFKKKSFPT